MDDQDLHEVLSTSGPGNLSTVIERAGDCVVVTLGGDVDMLTESAASAAVVRALSRAHRTMVIDLAGVTFFSSKGIQLLLTIAKAADGRDVELRVVTGTRVVDRPLQLAGVYSLLPLYPSREQALR